MDVDGFLECYKKTIIAYTIEYLVDEIKDHCEKTGLDSCSLIVSLDSNNERAIILVTENSSNILIYSAGVVYVDLFDTIEPVTLSIKVKNIMESIFFGIEEAYISHLHSVLDVTKEVLNER